MTGTLSSGKSSVCRCFEHLGAHVVSADALLHEVYFTSHYVGRRIVRIFGDSIVRGQSLDRAQLAERVFNEPELLRKLEDVCHPFVNEEIRKRFQEAVSAKKALFVAEVPLLFESRYPLWSWFDATVAVIADKHLAKSRYLLAGGSEEQFAFRSCRQLSAEEKARRATYVIINNGSVEGLAAQVQGVFGAICSLPLH